MKTAIFIRTYDGDNEWLYFCLRSLTKYCRGYSFLAIVYQPGSVATKKQVKRWRSEKGDRYFDDGCREYDDADATGWEHLGHDGYLHQQVSKMRADTFVPPETDFICHVDSDCTFLEPHTPEIYFHDGKPIMLRTPYRILPDDVPWQAPTSTAIGEPVEFEYMRRFPIVYPVKLYSLARDSIMIRHNRTLSEFVASVGAFSEFNYMGAFAHLFMKDSFHWIDTETEPFEPLPLKQYWSHGGIDGDDGHKLAETIKDWNKGD